jgi:hypothetical protein
MRNQQLSQYNMPYMTNESIPNQALHLEDILCLGESSGEIVSFRQLSMAIALWAPLFDAPK